MSMRSHWTVARGASDDNLGPLARFLEGQRAYRGLSKTALAERIGVDRKTYYSWLVDPSKMSTDRLERLSTALGMTVENRAVLYDLSGRAMPVRASQHTELDPTVLNVHTKMINAIGHAAVLIGPSWEVVLTNAPFRRLFASVPRYGHAVPTKNTMLYILLNPAAKELLGGSEDAFEEDWLQPSLATFDASLQQRPQDPYLLEIKDEITRRKWLQRAYRDTPDWIREHSDLYVNADARRFVHPELGETVVHLLTEAHLGYQPVQLTRSTFLFDIGD
ncbi:MmyB family transcriptional regulator [Streptomyces xanthophaeus]